MNTVADTDLSDSELAELDEFLLTHEECLAIDEAHGYLTALIVSRADDDESAILEAVLGEAEATAQINELLLRMYQDIAIELESAEPFEPMVIEEEDEDGDSFEVYDGWCFGFMLALSDYEEVWRELPKEQQSLLEPIATLALLREDELDMDDEEYAGWVSLLPGSVSGLYDYWH
ncbi:hypothetical protein Tel_15350 [Candidatus Tenderia electrophaga]|jgi:yecA family protein|uniref:Metal-binding protein n=1 Tax=Candidatus Tenderia electrophaga TaxID=1748243 RepID=A0A0S2TGY6_9GAMM|nr:hypothetical protein Tel_15350 [Candidatus Tenderia electrophaga]